jgi:hypothetical protein
MIEYGVLLYRDVHRIVRRYVEKLLAVDYPTQRVSAQEMELLQSFLSKHKLREGEVLSPYETPHSYYLVDGSHVTKEMYGQLIGEFEDEVRRRGSVKTKRLKLSPYKRELLNTSIVRRIREYVYQGKLTREEAFWELARVSKRVLGHKLTKGQIEGRYKRWEPTVKD